MDGELIQRGSSADRGISLIELLVVVAILAILAVGVTIVPARFGNAETQSRVAFQTQFTALQELAIHGRAVYGLQVTPREMQAMRFRNGTWQLLGSATPWQGRAVLSGNGGTGTNPDILILPDGRYSAFELRLARWRCLGDGWRPIKCEG